METYLKSRYVADWDGKSPIEIKNFTRRHLAILFKNLGFKMGAEIGVDLAVYSKTLCSRIPNLKLYCVDPWKAYALKGSTDEHHEECFQRSKEALRGFDVEFMREYSMDAVKEFNDGELDFVYIDGDHRYSFVMDDLVYWNKKVRPGGIVSGHDYYPRGQQVIDAVHDYVEANDITRWFITDKIHPASFFWEKK